MLGLNNAVRNIRPGKRPSCDLGVTHGAEKSFSTSMSTQQYHEACLLICGLEEKGEAGENMEYFRTICPKMWEVVSKTLTGDQNSIQSMPQFLTWDKKNQGNTNSDWGQQQWSKELEKLFEGHIKGQVPNLTQKTVDKKNLEDHLKKLNCKITEMVNTLCLLPVDLSATYLKCLHVYLLKEVTSIAERKLHYHEQVLLYKWTTREHRTLYNLHQGAEDFDPMLFVKWFSENGKKIFSAGREAIREALKEILQREILWNSTPRADSQHCFSDIQVEATDICEAVKGMGDTLESRLKSALWEEFFHFLSSYEEFLKDKIDKTEGMISGHGVLMGLRTVRNSYTLRDTLKNLGKAHPESNIQELLDKCEHKGTKVVLKVLSPAMKEAFKRYFRKNSYDYENVLLEYHRALRNQEMEDKKMFNTVMEHRITTLYIKASFTHCRHSPQVHKVVQASCKLLNFFSNLDTDKEQLGTNPLTYMAEMLTTEDHNALQVTIKAFLNEHPDLRSEHLLAMLDIKGNLSSHEKRDLLYYLQERSIFPLEHQLKFFQAVDVNQWQHLLCRLYLCCC